MAFHFRFQTLLNYKQQLEDMLELRFTIALQHFQQEQARLEALQRDREQQLATLAEQQRQGALPVAEILQTTAYLHVLHARIQEQEQRVAEAAAAAEAARQELVAMMKERKILEKLREKDHARFLRWVEKTVARVADETYLARIARLRRRG